MPLIVRLGQEWIRTTEGVKPADLQSAPFGRFGTYPDTLPQFGVLSFRFGVLRSRPCNPVAAAGGMLYRARNSGVQVDFVRAKAQHCRLSMLPDLHGVTEL
jgi:hypothetical protein